MKEIKIGDTIKIIKMEVAPQYADREGVVTHIDDALFSAVGSCSVTCEAKVGEDVYLIYSISDSISEIVVGESRAAVKNEGSIYCRADFFESFYIKHWLFLIYAVG